MNPDVYARDRDPEHLHPGIRSRSARLLERLNAEGLPFRLFEGFRSPQRQRWLYAQGRTRPGIVVTKARAWRSYHQYGAAADLVLFEDGHWSWESAGDTQRWWRRMHALAREEGLQPLSWELPHVQLAETRLEDLARGRYPSSGDSTWAENLEQAIASWESPGAPPIPAEAGERPALAGSEPRFPPRGTGGWHRHSGGREWRYDRRGVFLREGAAAPEPLRTPGQPQTCRTLWGLYAASIGAAAETHQVAPELIVMTVATETGFARRQAFTGPATFRWEPGVRVTDSGEPFYGDYSAGPAQTLASTARWIIRKRALTFVPENLAPAYRNRTGTDTVGFHGITVQHHMRRVPDIYHQEGELQSDCSGAAGVYPWV